MSGVEIPDAQEAELVLAALVTAFPGWIGDFLESVAVADIYDPRVRRVVEHAGDAGSRSVQPTEGETVVDAQVRAMSQRADVDRRWLAEVVDEWACLGRRTILGPAIAEAARRRRVMAVARDIYRGAGSLGAADLAAVVRELASVAGAR